MHNGFTGNVGHLKRLIGDMCFYAIPKEKTQVLSNATK
jgi:hypothetical protein